MDTHRYAHSLTYLLLRGVKGEFFSKEKKKLTSFRLQVLVMREKTDVKKQISVQHSFS